MKILHNVKCWLRPTQTWMYTQLKYLPEDFESQVACLTTENLDQFGDVGKLYCLQDRCPKALYFLGRAARKMGLRRGVGWLKKALQEFRPDLVHSHFGDIGWRALPEISKDIPHVVTFYGTDLSRLPKENFKWKTRYIELFNRINTVLCEGEYMASCIEALGCQPAKIKVHRLGIRLDHIDYHPRTLDGKEPFRVLLAGTFTEKKGLPFALEALAVLSKEIEINVTVIGDSRASKADQIEKQKILRSVQKNGLAGRVAFLGYQPHTVLFKQAYKHHVFLSPSVTAANGDTEGGAPVTIIEMAATGMPVVSTRHCDIPGVILDGATGLLADERDVYGLYDKMHWLIGNPEKWRPMLDKGRAHLEANFDAVKQGKKLAEIYRQAVSNSA